MLLHRLQTIFGSLAMAVTLLIAIAAILAWGTVYESRFGTAAVQRVIYTAWWFQAVLAFLALNLAVAALRRYPWQRRHTPFVLAHLGIILILLGGIIGGIWGVEGQLVIPEGQSERRLQLPTSVLLVRERNPGVDHVVPTHFESAAWVREPNTVFDVPLADRVVRLTVDRYYPDAVRTERISGGGEKVWPAIRVVIMADGQRGETWLFAGDPDRYGAAWGEAHLLFLNPETPDAWRQLIEEPPSRPSDRGTVVADFPHLGVTREIPVPETMDQTVAIDGTPYRLTFKDYFDDFALGEQGPINRSQDPVNPAVSFVLTGPEGTDAHLLFALHPDFPALHGQTQQIVARVRYTHPVGMTLPPQTVAVIRDPSGTLSAVLTGTGGERERIEAVELDRAYPHPGLDYEFAVAEYHPRAVVDQVFTNRGSAVKAPAIHLVATEGTERAEAWLPSGSTAELPLGADPLVVGYGAAQRALPFSVKLLDFRKIDYPGTTMAAGFESDVELTDPTRGLILMRTISMNNPLRYRGYSLYQSSFIEGPVETTVLAARSDPGTPFVYAGFLIVIGGVIAMFVLRRTASSGGAP